MGSGGETGHVQAGFGDDRAGQLGADAGDFRESLGSGQHGGVCPGAGAGAGAAVGVHAPGGPDLCQVLPDPGGQGGDAGVAEGDLVQQHLRQLPMVVIEHAGQGLDQGVVLGFHPAAGQAGQDVGVALALITGHVSSRQAAIRSSSRSAARRAGTCTLHPMRCNSRSIPASV